MSTVEHCWDKYDDSDSKSEDVPNTDVVQIYTIQISNAGGFSPTPDSPHPNAVLDESKLKDIMYM